MVPGRGPQPAAGMIVGEAPGAAEETEGRPFALHRERELLGALKALGVDPAEIYFTNVVKERLVTDTGKTRAPLDAEVEVWLDILHQEILNTAPRAILALGVTAARALTGFPLPPGSRVANRYTAWDPIEGKKARLDWIEQIRPWVEAIS